MHSLLGGEEPKSFEIFTQSYITFLNYVLKCCPLNTRRAYMHVCQIDLYICYFLLMYTFFSFFAAITDLMIDWIYLLWISKVKPNYTIRNSLPGTTCDVNLSQTTLFAATMLINNCRVLKILQNCTFLLFSHQVFLYKFVSHGHCGPRK